MVRKLVTYTFDITMHCSEGLNIDIGESVARTDSEDTTATKIGWTHVPLRKVTAETVRDYAIETGGRDRISVEYLNDKENELKTLKKEVNVFAKMNIHMLFLHGFSEMGITNLKTISDMKLYWATNCLDPNARQVISYVLFGYFDIRPGWDTALEKEFMRRKNWVYGDKTNDNKVKKGCIARLICEMKVEQTRRIQYAGKDRGVDLTIKRKNPVGPEKNIKRRKGHVYFNENEKATTHRNKSTVSDSMSQSLASMFQSAAIAVTSLEGKNLNEYLSSIISMISGMLDTYKESTGPQEGSQSSGDTNEESIYQPGDSEQNYGDNSDNECSSL